MTQEEKAKAYDEALERARQIKDGKEEWRYSDLAEITPALTEIFPQLCESEDERIRKHLVEIVEIYWGTTNDPDKAKDLAYLEKRKEQKPVDKFQEYLNASPAERRKMNMDEILGDNKGHQKKPDALTTDSNKEADTSDCKYKNLDEIAQDYVDGVKEYNPEPTWDLMQTAVCYGYHLAENKQKPAEWNYPYGVNETADRLFAIAECLEMDGDCLFNGYSGTECGKFLRELARKQVECKPKEWKDRPANWNEEKEAKYQHEMSYIPKPENPAEKSEIPTLWSEEDEKMLVAISKALGCDTAEKILVNEGVTLMMAAGFLESLRPSWKPGEVCYGAKGDPDPAGVRKPSEE